MTSRARLSAVLLVLAPVLAACSASPAHTSGLAPGFVAEDVLTGLDRPTAVRFGPSGRAWIAEQAGNLSMYLAIGDRAPSAEADLSDHVLGRPNRGLLGLAPDPADESAAYILYTFPAPPGTDVPVWADDASNCPDGTTKSCVSTGVLSRLAFGADGTPSETVLARGWCHHHASHGVGDLVFGPDGALYATAGEGSVPEMALDDGTWLPAEQRCNEGAFASRVPPHGRAPGEWAGAVVRFAADDLALAASGSQPANWLAERATVVAYGLRNPFRVTFRPGTPELWIGDPGWWTWEEIDVIPDVSSGEALDFGWPCREGPDPAAGYAADERCAALTADPSLATEPWLVERVGQPLAPADGCEAEPLSISGIAFGPSSWPVEYGGGLLYADYSRGCVYVVAPNEGGTPDPERVSVLWQNSGTPVDLTRGPDGSLYVARFVEGVISRVSHE